MTQQSLWGEEFNLPTQTNIKSIVNKVKEPKQPKVVTVDKLLKSKKISIEDKLKIITAEVIRILGRYQEDTVVIKTKEQLKEYINAALQNGEIAIDTETNNSLDPLTCKLMGPCIYTPGQKNAYIPVNHVDPFTKERLAWQLTEADIYEQFSRLNNIEIITHNGKFDREVLQCTTGWVMPIYWDTLIGARLLNENELAGLKVQYISKIDSSIEKYSIEHLFKGIEYAVVDPDIFALYAATDSFMTYKLKKYQEALFNDPKNSKLYSVFKDIEMQVLPIVSDMEIAGIELDLEYCNRLRLKYHPLLEESRLNLDLEVERIMPQIELWRKTPEANKKPTSKDGKVGKSKSEQLSLPINFNSPTQLAILLYDVLKAKTVDKKNPRGTGKDILEGLRDEIPLCEMLLEHRKFAKLIDAFIDTLPTLVSPRDNRLHGSFDQLGTDTGRFSSKEPNLQQIPAKNKEIRMMFRAKDGYTLVGSDYSQQEPRLLTAYSQDPKLLEAYSEGKDMYAVMGTGVYKNDYWDNMEHYEDGSPNVEGKARRKKMKTLLLGIMYGMGPNRIASNMGCTLEEAEKIINDFYSGFPAVDKWMRQTEDNAMKDLFVEDFWGRRRNLPDLGLPEYSFKFTKKNFNPILGSNGIYYDEKLKQKYIKELSLAKSISIYDYRARQEYSYDKIKERAAADGLQISKNGGFISRAKRQCVNARIQGGAATMTKKAMIAIANDPLMKEYDFRLLIGVHDELIGECKQEFAEQCAERLTYLMKTCVPELGVALKCDPTIEKSWNEEDYINMLKDEYSKGTDLETLYKIHCESTKEQINKYLES